MDFGDIESEYSSTNLFNVVHIRESGFSQDAQYRPRKSPRKRLKVVRTSASLMIDKLKSVFWCPGDFTSRVRTRRNWRPECLRYLHDNRRDGNEGCDAVLRHGKRSFVPEVPKIYSIGLHSSARGSRDSDDLSSSCGVIRNRFGIDRRPIVCKYWIVQSTPTSSLSGDVSLKAHADRQTMMIDCTKSTKMIPQVQESNHNSHNSQSYERNEEKENVSDILWNDRVADDSSSPTLGDFRDPTLRKDRECDSRRTTRDAQIQTSSRKSLRRRKTRRGSKSATETVPRRKHRDNEPRILVAGFNSGSHSSSGRSHPDEPWLRVRVLENKLAEYIDKFTAVNRQIEEITATLRETCCEDGEDSRDNVENCDEYFSSVSDDARVNTINWSGDESRPTIARGGDTPKEKNDPVNVEGIVGESKSERCKNVREISHVVNLKETVLSPKNAIARSRDPKKIPNGAFGRDSVRATKRTVCSPNRISRNKTREKCRFIKRTSFDLDATKDGDYELENFPIEGESFNEACPKNNFAILDSDKRASDSVDTPADLEDSRYRDEIVEEKTGEVAMLEDIKKRIDRDFDDPPGERSENDTEDFLTVSRRSSTLDRRDVIGTASATTIEESKSTLELRIDGSTSIGAMSERSNKNSALSMYFSCTQIPSLISLTENEGKLETADRDIIGSRSNPRSNHHYYESRSNLSPNNCSLSNLDSSLDRSRFSLEYVARYDPPARCTSPIKLESSIGTANEANDAFETSEGHEGFAEDKICEWYRPPGGAGDGRGKERRAERRYTADSTLETSKSSRCVGSIDSGVFSSSLIDLHPGESSFDAGESKFRKKRRAGKRDGTSATDDSDSELYSSCTDDTLDRKVNDVVRDLTKNLILCERRARLKLRARDARYHRHVLSRACKLSGNLDDTRCDFFDSPQRSSEDERIVSISTPSLLSLSDSEIEDCESRRQRGFC